LVGLKVPETGVPVSGMKPAAVSSIDHWIATASVPPITSETRINFTPVGPTNSMSTSDGKVWLIPLIVTDTFVTGLLNPATVMVAG
jgi:hypothetical protein